VTACAAAETIAPVEPALAELANTRWFGQSAISPDGSRVAYVQLTGGAGRSIIYVVNPKSPAARLRITAGDGKEAFQENGIAWSADGKQLAFLSDRERRDQQQLYVAPAGGGPTRQITHLKGLIESPRWSPDGKRMAILFTENLERSAGPLDPVPLASGVIESKIFEQRLAVVDMATGAVQQLSPADLYVYEYDWSPDGRQFAVTASPGEGDNNWWIAQIYTVSAENGATKSIYKPLVQQQIAFPRWSPDGKSVSFIGGIMSDQGSTGGDVFAIPGEGGAARDLTPGLQSSASSLQWRAPSKLFFTEHFDGGGAISELDPATGQIERLWQGDESIGSLTLSADGKMSAVSRNSFENPPEIWAGSVGNWQQLTRENPDRKPVWGESKSLHWFTNGPTDGARVQGWLIYPKPFDPAKKYPMVVSVHGGPASAVNPAWPRPGSNATLLSQQGYFVFMPNPRGSYGQGEKFTLANVKDFGRGDLADILAGVDEAVRTAPIDPQRIGITGWSYGGYMTMWAVTQTNRFHAAVAGAGLSNWQSYYGENAIDQWMIPYFGASVYEDPAVYAKSSPIEFIKQVKTPTLMLVGDRDGECPAPQSFEFWHALKTLGVKTELVVYPNEGHRIRTPEHQRDIQMRMVEWFNKNLR